MPSALETLNVSIKSKFIEDTSYTKPLAKFLVCIRINFRNDHFLFLVLIGIRELLIGGSQGLARWHLVVRDT
jgi:hypothetical protein